VIAHVKIQFEINSQRIKTQRLTGLLVIAHVKIQFEINSQQDEAFALRKVSCDCSRKNTI